MNEKNTPSTSQPRVAATNTAAQEINNNTASNSFRYYHESTPPSNQEVHAITMKIKQLLVAPTSNSDTWRTSILVVNLKMQSVATHLENIPVYTLILRTDLLIITETWMGTCSSRKHTQLSIGSSIAMRTPNWPYRTKWNLLRYLT